MSKSFEDDWRRKQEMRMRPFANKIYKDTFGDDIKIERFERSDIAVLDIHFAIDVQITMPNGQILLGQEKFLSNKYAKYKTITVEYRQDAATREEGDWFKLAPQFYFVGYCNKLNNGFKPWVIADWTSVVVESNKNNIDWSLNVNQYDGARASFAYTQMTLLPENTIIACSWD